MAIERNTLEEQQARLDVMIAEHRVAEQRRLVKLGIALWNRTESSQQRAEARRRPETIN